MTELEEQRVRKRASKIEYIGYRNIKNFCKMAEKILQDRNCSEHPGTIDALTESVKRALEIIEIYPTIASSHKNEVAIIYNFDKIRQFFPKTTL
jgi:hypothetical protein